MTETPKAKGVEDKRCPGFGCNLNERSGEVPWDPDVLRKVQSHPCYSRKAAHRFGRMHLAVAPRCNIQCNYCVRKYDCVHESRPGVTSRILTPSQALERVIEVVERFRHIQVVGIAGPGEPLVNPETFETFRLVKETFPDLKLCTSSNGLLLEEKIGLLSELGVQTITVTVNAIDPSLARHIYASVSYRGRTLRGLEGARVLVKKQLAGIRIATDKGLVVKINTVLIPTINDHHILDIATEAKRAGASVLNVMPLIPQHKFAHLDPPSKKERKAIQDQCAAIIPQMRHCRQCRADAVGMVLGGRQKNPES